MDENKLRFQIDAFRFYREPNNQVAAGPLSLCFYWVLTMATVNLPPDLCHLLREGGPSPSSRQPSEQGVLFNGEQVQPPLPPPQLRFKEGGPSRSPFKTEFSVAEVKNPGVSSR